MPLQVSDHPPQSLLEALVRLRETEPEMGLVAGVEGDAIRVLRVRGESMEPELSEGDRLLVDTPRRVPAIGEMFVLWDGNGLVVKRVERVAGDGSEPGLRLKSANAEYADYVASAGDVHVAGKVLWTVRRV